MRQRSSLFSCLPLGRQGGRCAAAALAAFGAGLGAAQALPTTTGRAPALEWPLYLSPPPQPRLETGALTCPPPQQPAVRAAWAELRRLGETDLSCGNRFADLLETASPVPLSGPDAFTKANQQILKARAEVLISNMDFYPEAGAPTWALLDTLAGLYRRVQADPAASPDGLSIRLHLGGYPLPQRPPRWMAAQLARGLLERGVPLQDPALGWRVQVAAYRLTPYSHAKLHIIDGREATAAGYGYGLRWLPRTDADGAARSDGGSDGSRGGGVSDLGLTLRGPVAQSAAAAFFDLWALSDELHCPADVRPAELTGALGGRCSWQPARVGTRPAAAQRVVVAGDAAALMLYRRSSYPQADRAGLAFLGAAQRRIDLLQTSMSAQLNCVAVQPWPDICRGMPLPPYFEALLDAMERGVQVRVLTMDTEVEGLYNRTGVLILRRAALERGLEDRLEVRATTYPMHTKAVVVDGAAALVGSINFHPSAWGPLGLAEAGLLTDDPAAVGWLQRRVDQDWAERSRPFSSYLK